MAMHIARSGYAFGIDVHYAKCIVHPMSAPQSFAAIIDLWPTVAAFASDVGAKEPTAAAWKQRDSIPSDRWLTVIAAADKRGHCLTLELLAGLAEQRKAAS